MNDNLFLVHGIIIFKLRSKLKHIIQYSLSCSFLTLEISENFDPTTDGYTNFSIFRNFFNNVFKFFFKNYNTYLRNLLLQLEQNFRKISSAFFRSFLLFIFFNISGNFAKFMARRIFLNILNTVKSYFRFTYNFFKQVFPQFF